MPVKFFVSQREYMHYLTFKEAILWQTGTVFKRCSIINVSRPSVLGPAPKKKEAPLTCKMYMKESIKTRMSKQEARSFLVSGEAAEEMCKEKK